MVFKVFGSVVDELKNNKTFEDHFAIFLAFFFRKKILPLFSALCFVVRWKKYYVVNRCVAGVELKEGDSELNSRQAITLFTYIPTK